MAKTPFYKVSIRNTNDPNDDRDISPYISEFTYEDGTDVDNMLTIEIRTSAKQFLDDPVFAEGSYLTFSWGYLQGKQSSIFILRIANIQAYYETIIRMQIQATDLGILMKKNQSKKDWKNTKASEIARQIASFYGLKPVVDDSETVHAFMPQGGKTDYNFMKYLSKIQKTGSWRFFIKNDTLYFTRLKLEQESFKTFKYMDPNGTVISFSPYSRETSKSNAARNTVITSVDPFTNKPVQKVINDSTSKDDVKLGDYPAHIYNADGQEIAGPSKNNQQKRPSQIQNAQKDPDRAGVHIWSPGDSEESENVGNSEKKGTSLEEYMANLETEGDPDMLSDIVITMGGEISKRDIGNWFITRAKHMITPEAGYICEFTMHKNATQKAGTNDNNAKQPDTNKTVGKIAPETKKVIGVYTYDGDAHLISSPTK